MVGHLPQAAALALLSATGAIEFGGLKKLKPLPPSNGFCGRTKGRTYARDDARAFRNRVKKRRAKKGYR